MSDEPLIDVDEHTFGRIKEIQRDTDIASDARVIVIAVKLLHSIVSLQRGGAIIYANAKGQWTKLALAFKIKNDPNLS